MRVRYVRSAAGLALVALLAGCGTAPPKGGTFHPNGGPQSPITATSPSAQTTTSPVGPPSLAPATVAPTAMTTSEFTQAVLDDYRAYQRVYELAFESADPSGLASVTADPALASITGRVQQTAAQHLTYRFALQLNPKVQTWQADRKVAVVGDCMSTIAWASFSLRTGKRVASGSRSAPKLYRYALKYDSNARIWKVYAIEGGAKC